MGNSLELLGTGYLNFCRVYGSGSYGDDDSRRGRFYELQEMRLERLSDLIHSLPV